SCLRPCPRSSTCCAPSDSRRGRSFGLRTSGRRLSTAPPPWRLDPWSGSLVRRPPEYPLPPLDRPALSDEPELRRSLVLIGVGIRPLPPRSRDVTPRSTTRRPALSTGRSRTVVTHDSEGPR